MSRIEDMFKKTTIRTCNDQTRRYYKGEKWARILWDLLHPELSCCGYDVHHRDGDKLNDSPDNLQLLTHGEHARLHHIGCSNPMFGKFGINNPIYGKKRSDETRKKISLNHANVYDYNSKNRRIVMCEYQIYTTMARAAKILSVTKSTIFNRIHRQEPGYLYIT